MNPAFAIPWLLALVALPLLAAAMPPLLYRGPGERRLLLWISAVELGLAAAAAFDFHLSGAVARADPFDPGIFLLGRPLFFMDELSSLLLPFGALVFGVVALILPRTERLPGSARRMLGAEAAVLGTFSTAEPALLAVFWILFATIVPPQRRVGAVAHGSRRAVASYMTLSVVLFVAGVTIGYIAPASPALASAGRLLLVAAVMTRKGIAPLHSWMLGFFERAALPEAILFSAPQIGAYAAVRLIVPQAPDAVLAFVSIASLVTAVYGAGLALVQTDAHRAFGAFFMSQSALVMTGLHSGTSIGIAGGLSLWISSGLALTGFAMALAALEARRGTLSLREFAGGQDRTPFLAASFLLLGLAAVGFPGTLGFVAEGTLVEGVTAAHPLVGICVLVTSALNGLLVLRMFFLLFGGARVTPDAHHVTRLRERAGFLALIGFLLAAGLGPHAFLESRQRAAELILAVQAQDQRPHSGTGRDVSGERPDAARSRSEVDLLMSVPGW